MIPSFFRIKPVEMNSPDQLVKARASWKLRTRFMFKLL